jgi:hypothetical protein
VFGAMIGEPWKTSGRHEPLLRGEVLSSKRNQVIDQGSHCVIPIAFHHLLMQFIQAVHDGLMLLVHLSDAYRVSALPTKRKHRAHLRENTPTHVYRQSGWNPY